VCGDAVVEGDEECDEGDANVDGGGCNSDCTITSVAFVATGQHHTCAQIDGGRLRCWGRGEFGQLGYGNTEIVGDDEYPSDVGDVMLPGPVVHLSLGGQHSCAVLQDGGLRCWGLNDRGQLGYGNTNNLGDDELLAMLPSISVPPTAQVELGNHHTCARVRNGEIRCWGYNEQGQLGYANTFNVEPVLEMTLPGGPVTIGDAASGLAVGFFHSCVTLVNGGARCWGRNDNGQLGYGHLNNIGDDELPNAVGLVSLIPQGLPPNTEVVSIALGGNHSCALLSGGALTCWGANASGQLGGGDIDTIGDDELPSTRPPIELGGPAAAVVTGANHTCALRTDGQVVCWGANNTGQLGYGHTDNIGDDELPDSAGTVELGGLATQIAAGANHTCAVLASRELICWGQNNYSQLGLGTSVTIGDNETPADAGPVPVL
jgi:alpha-tubulin suppressor-like RCC1 family protein